MGIIEKNACDRGGLVHRLRCNISFYVRGAWEDELLVQWITAVIIGVHMSLGFVIVVGGTPRFSVPTYLPLLDLVNGQVWVWGLSIILSAGLMATPFKWPNVVGLWLGMFWMSMWAACFSVSVVRYPTAAATPVVAYVGFAMINAALLTARLLERPRGR